MSSMSTTPAEKKYIVDAIRSLEARRVLEIGAFKGATTRAMSEAVPDGGYVVAIDPMEWGNELASNGIARHLPAFVHPLIEGLASWMPSTSYERQFWDEVHAGGRDNVHLFRVLSDDRELATSPSSLLVQFDLAFIDGDHSYCGALSDLETWGRRVRRGGLILVHDATVEFDGVVEAIEDFARDADVRVRRGVAGSLCELQVRSDLQADTPRRMPRGHAVRVEAEALVPVGWTRVPLP